MTILKTCLAACAAAFCVHAGAAVVHDNGAATGDSWLCADDGGRCMAAWVVYDDFTIAATTSVNAIRWTAYLTGGLGDLRSTQAWIYSADPVFNNGKLLHAITLPAVATRNALAANAYDLVIAGLDITLAPGSYWLGMHHHTRSNFASVYCTRNCVGGNSTQAGYHGERMVYRNTTRLDYAFAIEGQAAAGAVPVSEPGSLGLFGTGLLCAGLLRFRKTAVDKTYRTRN